MSSASEALLAIRKVVLTGDRMDRAANQVDRLAENLPRPRPATVRQEAEFERTERVAKTRRSFRGKSKR